MADTSATVTASVWKCDALMPDGADVSQLCYASACRRIGRSRRHPASSHAAPTRCVHQRR
ncbi:hypothetical protein KCP70_05185 [Salmonella enterica subsp. enterica]|nr:hypothetical protein KCP70_05185 [Salmonella enterica subsp. enterica]